MLLNTVGFKIFSKLFNVLHILQKLFYNYFYFRYEIRY